MKLRLYNTLDRKTSELTPGDGKVVRLYTCGPTVYNYLHVGNYRTYIFEDVLKRTMKVLGCRVRHVMNVTDVGHLRSDADEGEDKMAAAAKREGKTAWDIAKFYTKTFFEDAKKLNLDFKPVKDPKREDTGKPEDIVCHATDHIPEQQAMVTRLIDKGFTYETSDGIYFDTSKFPAYGVLVGKAHLDGLRKGSRVAMGEKKNVTDFALWKFSPQGERRQMEWDYRGRRGFPGWHIECSSMGQTYLGDTLDIHCGGVDHIPIHHTNEIAQAEAATGKPFCRVWLHAEFLILNKSKMAKSAEGFITLGDLEKKGFDPLDYRYFCFNAHYRKQLEFSWEGLQAAKAARRRLIEDVQKDLKDIEGRKANEDVVRTWADRFKDVLANDLNAPKALAVLHGVFGQVSSPADRLAIVREMEKVLALGLFDAPKSDSIPPEVSKILDDYKAARAKKDFKASDALRVKLKDAGYQVLDSKEGSMLRKL